MIQIFCPWNYMRNWNKIATVKTLFLLISAVPNLVKPLLASEITHIPFTAFLVFGLSAVIVPLISKFYNLLGWGAASPLWTDNPFKLSNHLSFFQLLAFFLLTIGISVALGTIIADRQVNYFSVVPIMFGLGVLVGIRLALVWNRQKMMD